MIIDSLQNSATYESLSPRLAKAFAYIKSHDLASLEDGRHPIEGDEIYAMISSPDLKKPEDAPIEVHNRYIDIQVVLSGEETFGWRERSELCAPAGPFDEAKDIRFWGDRPSTYFTLYKGQFAIFFPQDGHAPMIGEGKIKKCIVKVLR